MKKLFKKFETAMMAVAFAEGGDLDGARQIMNEDRKRKSERPALSREQRPENRKELRLD